MDFGQPLEDVWVRMRRARGKPEPTTRDYFEFNLETVTYASPVLCEYPLGEPHSAIEGTLAYPCSGDEAIFYCRECNERLLREANEDS